MQYDTLQKSCRVFNRKINKLSAEVAELVDAPVSKTGGGDSIPVRFRASAPFFNQRPFPERAGHWEPIASTGGE